MGWGRRRLEGWDEERERNLWLVCKMNKNSLIKKKISKQKEVRTDLSKKTWRHLFEVFTFEGQRGNEDTGAFVYWLASSV